MQMHLRWLPRNRMDFSSYANHQVEYIPTAGDYAMLYFAGGVCLK
jgi:hypothetical protein